MSKPNVLAVDDTPANLLSLEAVLGDDYNVLRADSGAAAIAILEHRRDINVILMDVHMPSMDGFETASRIKKLSGCKDIPIIFVTAVYKEDPYVRQGYEAGGIDYFGKPYDPDILRLKVGIYASYRQKAHLLKEQGSDIYGSDRLLSHNEPIQVACFDGTTKTILTSTSPLRGLDQQIVGAVILIQEHKDAKKIAEDLEHRVTRLIGLGVELEQSAHH